MWRGCGLHTIHEPFIAAILTKGGGTGMFGTDEHSARFSHQDPLQCAKRFFRSNLFESTLGGVNWNQNTLGGGSWDLFNFNLD